MEKVNITDIKEMPTAKGGKFWAVDLSDGRKTTIGQWDSKVADYVNDYGRGFYDVEIQEKGQYLNIKKAVRCAEQETPLPTIADAKDLLPTKNNGFVGTINSQSIVAQMCVKTAAELIKNDKFDTLDDFKEHMQIVTSMCVENYKFAFDELQN